MSFFGKTGNAIKESYNELKYKVSWPARSELTNSAVVVMIATAIIAICIFLVDFLFEFVMREIYKLIV